MVVRIDAISEWQCIEPGKVLTFDGAEPRRIRVEVNCPEPTRFDVVGGGGEVVFLAVVQGHETLIFTGTGETQLVPSTGGEVWFYTMDGFNPSVMTLEESFTGVMNRRERNPALERMEMLVRQNERRRDEALEAERAAYRSMMAEMSKPKVVDEDGGATATGTVSSDAGGASVVSSTVSGSTSVAGA